MVLQIVFVFYQMARHHLTREYLIKETGWKLDFNEIENNFLSVDLIRIVALLQRRLPI